MHSGIAQFPLISAFPGGTSSLTGETKNPGPNLAHVLAKFYIFVPVGDLVALALT